MSFVITGRAGLGWERGMGSVGGVHLTPYHEGFESQMDAARAVMKRRRQVLHALAK